MVIGTAMMIGMSRPPCHHPLPGRCPFRRIPADPCDPPQQQEVCISFNYRQSAHLLDLFLLASVSFISAISISAKIFIASHSRLVHLPISPVFQYLSRIKAQKLDSSFIVIQPSASLDISHHFPVSLSPCVQKGNMAMAVNSSTSVEKVSVMNGLP